jgi:hypothetical protein
MNKEQKEDLIEQLREQMRNAAKDLEFERAASLRDEIFFSSLSRHTTSFPNWAKQVPETRPTYPEPMIAIFMTIHET